MNSLIFVKEASARLRVSADSIAQRINDEAPIGSRTGQGWDKTQPDMR